MRHAGAVPERPLDELPPYVDIDLDVHHPRRATLAPPRYTARDVAVKVSTWVGEVVDGDGSMAPPSSFAGEQSAKDDLTVIHRVLGRPAVMLDAFDDRWGRAPSTVRVALGTLRLRPDTTAARRASLSRAVPGQLRLRTSFVPIPVELEIMPWQTYGLVLTLRPVRHVVSHIGWHRRWAWFSAGHRALDAMRRPLEADARRDRR